jgi:hypothetical protein
MDPEAKAVVKFVPALTSPPFMTVQVWLFVQNGFVTLTRLARLIAKIDPVVTESVPLSWSGAVKLVPGPLVVLLNRLQR